MNHALCWVRGTPRLLSSWRTPHPAEYDADFVMPSPARGEGSITSASRFHSSIVKQRDACLSTCVVAPCSVRPQGKPFHSCSFCSESVRNALAKNRFRGRPLARRASRTPFEKLTAHGQWFSPTREVVEPNRGLGRSFSPAFRTRMDLSACWMSQGLELVPPPPVRADCRPDIHSSRPLPLPWSAPNALVGSETLQRRPRPAKLADLRVPFHAA